MNVKKKVDLLLSCPKCGRHLIKNKAGLAAHLRFCKGNRAAQKAEDALGSRNRGKGKKGSGNLPSATESGVVVKKKRGWPKGKPRKRFLPPKGSPERKAVEKTAKDMADSHGWLPSSSKGRAAEGWVDVTRKGKAKTRKGIWKNFRPQEFRRHKSVRLFSDLKEYVRSLNIPPTALELGRQLTAVQAPKFFETVGRFVLEVLLANSDRFAKEFDFFKENPFDKKD